MAASRRSRARRLGAVDRWDAAGRELVLALAAATLGVVLARLAYVVAGVACTAWLVLDVSPEELLPVVALIGGLVLVAATVVVLRSGNPLAPWLAAHDLRQRQRDLAV